MEVTNKFNVVCSKDCICQEVSVDTNLKLVNEQLHIANVVYIKQPQYQILVSQNVMVLELVLNQMQLTIPLYLLSQ